MSRAQELLQRLEHFGHPSVNEQDPLPDDNDDNDVAKDTDQGMSPQRGSDDKDDQNIDPRMADPASPFSRVTHNTDGSLKVDQSDQPMNDRGRFVVRRRR